MSMTSRLMKPIILIIAVAVVGIGLLAWDSQPAAAPQIAVTNENDDEEATSKNATDVPEMLVLREGQSQFLFGGRLNVTLQKLDSMPCTPPINSAPGSNPCATVPVSAVITVADSTATNESPTTTSLVFPSIGAVQTASGYFYQFIELTGEGQGRSARFLVRALQPLTPPLPATQE